jgi:photosystem II stability/assembly factor-like uncharacterized protein
MRANELAHQRRLLWIVLAFTGFMSRLALFPTPALAHQPHDPIMLVAVSPNFAQDQTIFIATAETSVNMGLYLALKSTDGGITWEVMPLPNVQATAMAVSPDYANDQTLFIGTVGRGILRSTDGGASWQRCGFVQGVLLWNVTVSPNFAQDHTVFGVGVYNEIYKSTNRGYSWTLVRDFKEYSEKKIQTLVVSPAYEEDHTLFLGTAGDGVFKSADEGFLWRPVNVGLTSLDVTCLALSPAYETDQELFAGTLVQGVFRSADGGSSWVSHSDGITDLDAIALALHADYPRDLTIFATTRAGGVFKSTDGGLWWNPAGNIPRPLTHQSEVHYIAIAMSPNYDSDHTVFLAMFEGLWVSRDGGESWKYADVIPIRLVRGFAISPNYRNDRTVIMSTYGAGILKSMDGGESWATKNVLLSDTYPDFIGFSPNYVNDQIIIAGVPRGLEKSTDGAETWGIRWILGQRMFVRALAYFPAFAYNNTVIAGTNNKGREDYYFWYGDRLLSSSGVWISTDGGDTWKPTYLNGARIYSLAISPHCFTDRTVFAGVGEEAALPAGVYKSTDRGIHWMRMNTDPYDSRVSVVAISPVYAVDQTVFAGTLGGGVIKSTDGGETWVQCPGTERWAIMDLVLSPDFEHDQALYTATFRYGLHRSTDGGNSWSPTTLETGYFTALGISPSFSEDQTIFAAAYRGIFKSEDGGDSWEQLMPTIRYEDDNNPRIIYTSNWQDLYAPGASAWHVYTSATPLDTAEFSFVSSGVSWIGTRGPNHGLAEVYVDGEFQAIVDPYAPEFHWRQVLYQLEQLPLDYHTIEVVVVGSENPLSGGHNVSIDGFDVPVVSQP